MGLSEKTISAHKLISQ